MESIVTFVGSGIKLFNYGQKAMSLLPNLFEKTSKESKIEILDFKSTLIKLGIVWLSEKSNPCPTQATKLIVGNHTVTVLFPESTQGFERWSKGISVENLKPIYTCIETGLKQKNLNPESPSDLLYLAVGALGLRALGVVYSNRYIAKNDKKYLDAKEKLECCAEKIEKYLLNCKLDPLGLEKFWTTKNEKLYNIPIDEEVDPKKPIANFEVKGLFDESDDIIITGLFKKAISHLNEKYATSAMHLAISLNAYMFEIDPKHQNAVAEVYHN